MLLTTATNQMSPRKNKKEQGTPKKVTTKGDNREFYDTSSTTPPQLEKSKRTVYDEDKVMRMLLEGTAPVASNGLSRKTPKSGSKKASKTSGLTPAPVPTTPTKGGRKFYAGSMFDDSPAPGSLPKPHFLSEKGEEAVATPQRSLPTFNNNLSETHLVQHQRMIPNCYLKQSWQLVAKNLTKTWHPLILPDQLAV